MLGRYGSGTVLLKPAPEGTGVIAGGAVRAVMTSAGMQNVLTKSIGTTNPHNVIKATFDALKQLKNRKRRRRHARQVGGGAVIMPNKLAKKAVRRRRREDSFEVGALRDLRPGEAEAGGQGTGLHPAEPGDRAAGQPGHPRHGGEGAAPGGDR